MIIISAEINIRPVPNKTPINQSVTTRSQNSQLKPFQKSGSVTKSAYRPTLAWTYPYELPIMYYQLRIVNNATVRN